jgi:hypothetical protein
MYFSNQAIFNGVAIIAILLGTSSCAQDTMIKINSTSSVKLLPNKEIRYKACGESRDVCQVVLENVSSKKSELAKIANARYIEYRDRKAKVAGAEWQKAANQKIKENCTIHSSMSDYMRTKQANTGNIIGQYQNICQRSAIQEVKSSFVEPDRSSFNPTEEDHKKIISEISSANLNEYTFSKSDGSIVVICPTRYCAIANADSGWIGIGERGKQNQLEFLISN